MAHSSQSVDRVDAAMLKWPLTAQNNYTVSPAITNISDRCDNLLSLWCNHINVGLTDSYTAVKWH